MNDLPRVHREVFRYVEDGFEDVDVVALDFATARGALRDRRTGELSGRRRALSGEALAAHRERLRLVVQTPHRDYARQVENRRHTRSIVARCRKGAG